ncbi:cytochrome P450 [Streptomyces sp. NPDC058691]|uniref:cytochrome P450 family protein n=1 Tax=Streptomyces sp. NPDC058691 TaxID=3346601 RepID=UPI00365E1EF6
MSDLTAFDGMLNPFTAVLDGQRHEAYAALAAEGPVAHVVTPAGVPAWIVTDHAVARALLSDPRCVKGGWHSAIYADRLPEDIARGLNAHMLNSNPPEHTRLRKLVTSAFTRRRVEKLIPGIERMTEALLTAADTTEPVDLLSALAYPLPISVICELIGVPEEGRAQFQTWSSRIVSPGVYPFEEYERAASEILDYSRALIDEKRTRPQDDLLSDLIAARDNGEGLSEDELTAMMILLLLAGHETTVNLIGNGVRALLVHPDQMELLRTRPELLPSAIEEMLRYDAPLQNTLPYRTTEAIDVGGATLPEGAMIYVTLQAANRDDTQFPSSGMLDITREGSAHIAFGHGIHYCVGAPLARVEARIVFRTLLDRFPRLRPAVPVGSLTRRPSVIMNGLAELPVYLR